MAYVAQNNYECKTLQIKLELLVGLFQFCSSTESYERVDWDNTIIQTIL